MSQRVPSLDFDDNPITYPNSPSLRPHSNSTTLDVPAIDTDVYRMDYEVAELTWENGQLVMHGLGLPQVPSKPAVTSVATTAPSKYTWEKPPAGGTLESIVNQATCLPHRQKVTNFDGEAGGCRSDFVTQFDHHKGTLDTAAAAASATMDALVPCSNSVKDHTQITHVVGCTSHMGSCSGTATHEEDAKHAARVPMGVQHEWSRMDQRVSGIATFGQDSQQVTLDTCERELGVDFVSTSPENTSIAEQCTKATTADDHDSLCHSRPEAGDEGDHKTKGIGKSSVSTKRSRVASVHNQSERKRRDRINQRMKTLQKLVPNSSKADKASMLDEVIEYLKQLQAQVQMVNRMNMSPIRMPMTMQPRLQQMSMMAPTGMGMGMDMNTMGLSGISPILHPSGFMMPMASWDGSGNWLQAAPAAVMPDPLSVFLASQPQPMNMDAYSRMAAICQQMQQRPPASNSKS